MSCKVLHTLDPASPFSVPQTQMSFLSIHTKTPSSMLGLLHLLFHPSGNQLWTFLLVIWDSERSPALRSIPCPPEPHCPFCTSIPFNLFTEHMPTWNCLVPLFVDWFIGMCQWLNDVKYTYSIEKAVETCREDFHMLVLFVLCLLISPSNLDQPSARWFPPSHPSDRPENQTPQPSPPAGTQQSTPNSLTNITQGNQLIKIRFAWNVLV